MRRVLIISALQVFPVRSGGQMRTAGIARLLARSRFDVTVHSFTGRKPDLRSRRPSQFHAVEANLREYVDTNRLRLLISLVCYRLNIPPFWIYLERSVKRHRALASSIAESNVVMWDFPYLHQDADQVNGRVCILNTHNYETKLWSGAGWFNRILKYFVNRIERRAVSSSSTILVCSEADKKALQGLGGSAEYLVVSNGVDPNRFVNCKQDREPIRARSGFNDSKVILYSASAYAPNVAGLNFLREIAQKFAPELRQRKIRFLVVGSVSREANSDEFVVQAEVLGILAWKNIYSAFYWTIPPQRSFAAAGFAALRNYDGNGAAFGDEFLENSIGVNAYLSVFASRRKSDGKIVVLTINKSLLDSVSISWERSSSRKATGMRCFALAEASGPSMIPIVQEKCGAVAPRSLQVIEFDGF